MDSPRASFPAAEGALAQSLSEAALDEFSSSTNMAEVTLALTSETDVRKLAGIILGKCRLLARGDRSTLFLMDEDKRELVEFAYDGGGDEGVELRDNGIRVAIGSGVAGHCAASGTVLHIQDAHEDARWDGKELDQRSGYRTRQLLCCPIMGPTQRMLGVMQIVNTTHEAAFATKDIAVVQTVAYSAGVALENAHSLARAQQKEMQLSVLLGAMDALLFTFDAAGLLVSCSKTSESTIRWKSFVGKHFSEWLAERNGALNADMAAAYSEHKSASAPQYAFKSGLTHTYVNYKAIAMTDASKTFQGVLLLLEPCSNHAQLVHALSRHMGTAAVAAAVGPTETKLKGKPVPLTLLMLSLNGPSLCGSAAPETRVTAINEAVAEAAKVVSKEGGMLLQLSGPLVVAAFGYAPESGGASSAPESVAAAAAQACRCAQALVSKFDKLVEAKKKKIAGGAEKRKAVELQVAAGVHTGICCVGTVGHEKLLNLAVLGDAATLA